MNIEIYDLHKDLKDKLPLIWDFLLNSTGATPEHNKPFGVIVGCQAGAGKSQAIEELLKTLDNVLVINTDEYRKYHEYYEEIQKIHGEGAGKYTGEFAWEITKQVFSKAVKEKYNIILETTFRTEHPSLAMLSELKANNYSTKVFVCTCSKYLSKKSIQERAEKMKLTGDYPRYVPENIHAIMVKRLPKVAEVILNSGLVDQFLIRNRNKIIFDSEINKQKNIGEIIKKELNQPLNN